MVISKSILLRVRIWMKLFVVLILLLTLNGYLVARFNDSYKQ